MSRRHRIFALVAALAIAGDQLTKAWVRSTLGTGRIIVVVRDYFDLQLSYNHGSAFSLFDEILPNGSTGLLRWLLTAAAIVACLAMLYVLHRRIGDDRPWTAAALALIFGGALGNLIDRLAMGHVTDFVLWKATDAHRWPYFNVADAALVVGVAILFLADLGRKKV